MMEQGRRERHPCHPNDPTVLKTRQDRTVAPAMNGDTRQSEGPPPGWYEDINRNDPYHEFYWDGAAWTGHCRRVEQPSQMPVPTGPAFVHLPPVSVGPNRVAAEAADPPAPTSAHRLGGAAPTDWPAWSPKASGAPRNTEGTTQATSTGAVERFPPPRNAHPVTTTCAPDPRGTDSADSVFEPTDEAKGMWVQRTSLRVALIVGWCAGLLVAFANPSAQALNGPVTVKQGFAVFFDAAMAGFFSACVWGLIVYVIALRVKRRKVKREPRVAAGPQRETHPGMWLASGAAAFVVTLALAVANAAL